MHSVSLKFSEDIAEAVSKTIHQKVVFTPPLVDPHNFRQFIKFKVGGKLIGKIYLDNLRDRIQSISSAGHDVFAVLTGELIDSYEKTNLDINYELILSKFKMSVK